MPSCAPRSIWRYAGQAFELSIEGALEPDPDELRGAFDRAHEERYGYSDAGARLELVTVRVAAALPGAEPPPAAAGRAERRGTRGALFDWRPPRRGGAWPGRGRGRRSGHLRAARVDARRPARLAGALRCRRGGDGALSGLDPVTLQVMLGALRAACDEMGAVLVRSAHSANIKERRDASTALFDERGRMVMQAEHIPVHLGAMPSAVAALLDEQHEPGVAWILNDPLPRRHAPAGHHRHRAPLPSGGARRLRRQPCPSRRRRGARAGQHAVRLAHAGRRGGW